MSAGAESTCKLPGGSLNRLGEWDRFVCSVYGAIDAVGVMAPTPEVLSDDIDIRLSLLAN